MVLFGRTIFLTGVIAAQSQHRAAKVCLYRKISDVKKKSRAQKQARKLQDAQAEKLKSSHAIKLTR